MILIKNNKYFLFIFFITILFFSSHVLSDDHFTINFNQQEEWELTCNDFKSANFNDSKKYTQKIPIVLKKTHDIPRNVYDDHLFTFSDGKSNQPELIFYDNADKSNEITDKVYDAAETEKNDVFCFPNENNKVPDHLLTVKINPITFFTITCNSPNVEITAVEMSNKIKESFPNFNKEDLVNEIYDYTGNTNRLNDVLSCNKVPIEKKFFYKKLANKSEVNLSNITDESNNTFTEIKLDCDVLPDEILENSVTNGSREDCTEELNKRNNFRDEKNLNLENLEKLKNIYNDNNITEILSTGSINKIIEDIEDLTKDLEILNLDEINIQYQEIYASVKKYKTIFSLYYKYSLICSKESKSELNLKYTTYQDYQNKCVEIAILENFKNNEDRINTWNDKDKIKEFEASISILQSEINEKKQLIENQVAEEIKIENEKNSISKNINILKTKIEQLKRYIENENSKLIKKNKNFNKKEEFNSSKNLISIFEKDKSDITDLITKTNKKISIFKIEDDKKNFEDELTFIEDDVLEIENKISNYKKEFSKYKINMSIRNEYKEEKKRQDKLKEEELKKKQKEKKIAQKKIKDATVKKEKEDKINQLISDINIIENKLDSSLKNFKSNIEIELKNLNTFIDNFKATDENEINFNSINNIIEKNKNLINVLLDDYDKKISSLSNTDFDAQTFDYISLEALQEKKLRFEIKFGDIQDDLLTKLEEKITEANKKIDSRESELINIVDNKNKELENQIKEKQKLEDEKNKLEDEKRKVEEDSKAKEKLIENKEGLLGNKDKEIAILEKEKLDLESSLALEKENVNNRNLIIYLLIGLLLVVAGLLVYFIIRKKPSSSNNDEGYVSKINELEQRLEREIQQSRAQANNQTTTPIKTEAPKEIKKEPTQEEIKNEQLRKLYEDYNAAMKNPNLIETFQSNYNAIGLERESKISTGRKIRLRRVNTSFDRAIFWVVEHDRKLLVFGGRMLKVQAPSLLADDGTMARDLLQGIFALQTGPDLKTHKCAIVHKNNQIYEVMIEGTLQLPKID